MNRYAVFLRECPLEITAVPVVGKGFSKTVETPMMPFWGESKRAKINTFIGTPKPYELIGFDPACGKDGSRFGVWYTTRDGAREFIQINWQFRDWGDG